MRRRDFVKGIVGLAAAWPLVAGAQQPEQVRRIGVLMNVAASDPEGQPAIALFQQSLQKLGWTVGSNVQIDDRDRKLAAELVASAPDVIVAAGHDLLEELQPLSAQTVFEIHKSRNIAARPGECIDDTRRRSDRRLARKR